MDNVLNQMKVTDKFSSVTIKNDNYYFRVGLMDGKEVCLIPVFDCRLPCLPEVHLVLAYVKENVDDEKDPFGLMTPLTIEAIWLKETDLSFFYDATRISGYSAHTSDLILSAFLKDHCLIEHLYLEANGLAANEPEKILRLAQERRHDWSVFTSLYSLNVRQHLGKFIRKYINTGRFKTFSDFKKKFKPDAGDGLKPQGSYRLMTVRRNSNSGLYDGVGVIESLYGRLFFEFFGVKNDEEIEKRIRNLFGSDFDFNRAQIYRCSDSDSFERSVLDGSTDEAFEKTVAHHDFYYPGETGIGRAVLFDEKDWFIDRSECFYEESEEKI